MSALLPSINLSTASMLVLSPQSRRCSPNIHRSPNLVVGSSGRSGTASSSVRPSVGSDSKDSISLSSKPSKLISNSRSFNSSNSTLSISSSQPALRANLLSAMIYAFFCASVKCLRQMVGTLPNFSLFAAITRPCPAIIILSWSTRTGLVNPNSFMLETI